MALQIRTPPFNGRGRPGVVGEGRYVGRMDRTLTLADVLAGRVPDDLAGVRWHDGTVECRANLVADDYAARHTAAGRRTLGHGVVLTDPSASCDRCADKCG